MNIKKIEHNNITTLSFESPEVKSVNDTFPLEISDMSVLDGYLAEEFALGNHSLIIDLTNISYMCSYGLSVFFNAHRKYSNNGGKIVFLNPNPSILKLFSTLKVINIFEIYDNKMNAIRSFTK
ncbi:MAG: hypothetical protein A2Y40_05205 [Candidatus Margulisbacteria bacterium GWF2_35_9]|nr:MAG: hypothetical protein A2Y40_05205 [Candidatus Margulisbacteria bacterium GWF2_35_9]